MSGVLQGETFLLVFLADGKEGVRGADIYGAFCTPARRAFIAARSVRAHAGRSRDSPARRYRSCGRCRGFGRSCPGDVATPGRAALALTPSAPVGAATRGSCTGSA